MRTWANGLTFIFDLSSSLVVNFNFDSLWKKSKKNSFGGSIEANLVRSNSPNFLKFISPCDLNVVYIIYLRLFQYEKVLEVPNYYANRMEFFVFLHLIVRQFKMNCHEETSERKICRGEERKTLHHNWQVKNWNILNDALETSGSGPFITIYLFCPFSQTKKRNSIEKEKDYCRQSKTVVIALF